MKKYNVFTLFVIKIDEQKFICECTVPGEKYREILTGRKIELKNKYIVEKLSDYYSVLAVINYETKEPLMLSKESILSKYIDINMLQKENDYYEEQTDLSSIIDDIIEKPDEFYKMVGEQLTPEERIYIRSLIPKSCNTCSNGCCRVEQVDKPIYDCIGWENDRLVGKYKVLKLNRKNKEDQQ